jgi:versiconal hemiacetal acetate esterase
MTQQTGYDEQWLKVSVITRFNQGRKLRGLKLEESLGSRPAFSGSVPEIREQFEAVGRLIGPLFPAPNPEVAVWDEVSQHGLRLRVYQPKSASIATGGFPVGVYYHGGGFMLGDLNAEDADCRYFSRHAPCVIVAVDYRLAPEHKFDEILRDAVQGYEWVG